MRPPGFTVCRVERQIVDIAMSLLGDGQIRVVPFQTHNHSTAANDLRCISGTGTSAQSTSSSDPCLKKLH
jgi:hypothetical protein